MKKLSEFSPLFVRADNNYDVSLARERFSCSGKERVKQSFKEECDINTIVRRFGLTGQLPTAVRAPTYGDFSDIPSYQEARNALIAADQAFMAMPADIRARFHNNPAEFVDFCSNDDNRAEAERLGLVLPEVPIVSAPAATPAGDVSPASPAAASA